MAKRGPRGAIRLKSTASAHCYYSEKNSRNKAEKVKVMKFDPTPNVRKHVMYEEGKMK